jgi:hypothetical protein
MLKSLRTGIFHASFRSVLRDWLEQVQVTLRQENALAQGKALDPVTTKDKMRVRRLARSVGHLMGPWEPFRSWKDSEKDGQAVTELVSNCLNCKAPLFLMSGGTMSPLYPCKPYKRPTYGKW